MSISRTGESREECVHLVLASGEKARDRRGGSTETFGDADGGPIGVPECDDLGLFGFGQQRPTWGLATRRMRFSADGIGGVRFDIWDGEFGVNDVRFDAVGGGRLDVEDGKGVVVVRVVGDGFVGGVVREEVDDVFLRGVVGVKALIVKEVTVRRMG